MFGCLLWFFGFSGVHRFYCGKSISGTIYFFPFGLAGVGWLIDLFLLPALNRKADRRYKKGMVNYNPAWVLLTFLGLFGVHRMYMGKWVAGILFLFTGGLFLIGFL